ncbi:DUF1810 domain-containing protein [Flavobacterium luteolum]|uniref:DUF1810 domain-containing protein n=1 Tax=Flavobacterium luteolum TaxID=3003259 RepID=UPI00248F1816|nr:DUF1810 domain-containing protein [Flavobacterium luteolum]
MNLEDGLERYISAQKDLYHQALDEIKDGKKLSHWMWFVFPQIRGLGFTDYNVYYGIKDLYEAEQYLCDPVLGKRLVEITNAAFSLEGNTALEIFGRPDSRKLKSCMTLFSQLQNTDPIFQKVLDKYYDGLHDEKTISILASQKK